MENSNKYLTFTKYFIIFTFFVALTSNVFSIINFLNNDLSHGIWNFSNKGVYYFIAFILQFILILLILIFTYQLMKKVDIKDYFNSINYGKLFLIANFTLIYAGLNLLKKYLDAPVEYRTLLDTTVDTNQLLFILAIVILTSLDIYDESKKIKEENDLTI
ncbi:hypothetical protein ACMGE9_10000 [Macrococcus sp. EM39E]|uniref:hypothetical protein n=1 Tax=Macrococcus animalis TaxID=3395467 RepID=UPI0039BEC86D